MSYKNTLVKDLVCDHCGRVFINENRSTDDVLLKKALESNWQLDDNGKIYCPDCIDKKVTTELNFFWPNYFRMSIAENKIQNSGNNNPIRAINDDEANKKLYIMLDANNVGKFDQMDIAHWEKDLSEWQKTSKSITVIYPELEIIFTELICVDYNVYADVAEYVFTYKDKTVNNF